MKKYNNKEVIKDCKRCGGSGEIYYWGKGRTRMSKKCPKCKGLGSINKIDL